MDQYASKEEQGKIADKQDCYTNYAGSHQLKNMQLLTSSKGKDSTNTHGRHV